MRKEEHHASLIKKTAKDFANLHNEGLSYVYEQMTNSGATKSLSNDKPALKESALAYTNNFINEKLSKTLKSDAQNINFELEDFEKNSNEVIYNKMSEREKFYIDQVTSKFDELIAGESFEYLLDMVVSDNSLTEEQKTAVCIFICTAEKSAEYWNENYSNWQMLTGNDSKLKLSYREEKVIFSDCYWGWYGFLSSGCNPAVGIGASAAASLLAVL